MVLRIGVEDGEEATARQALAEAAKGCVDMFQKLRAAWRATTGAPTLPIANAAKTIRRKTPKVAPAKLG
jgi:hypothetical protein